MRQRSQEPKLPKTPTSPSPSVGVEHRMWQMEQQIQQLQESRKLVFRSISGVFACAILLWTTSYLMAAAPPIVYSGYLEENGLALSGNRKAELTLWTDASSTDAATHRKCQQTINAQAFVKGRFKIPLDAACTKATHDNANLWVQLTIWDAAGATGKELARTRLGTVPHAIRGTIQFGTKSYTTNALYVGITSVQYKGADVQGWAGGKAKCEALYGPTAHMCSGEDLIRSVQVGALADSHFVNSGVTPRHFWFASSDYNAHYPPNGTSLSDGSCYGWTSSNPNLLGATTKLEGGIRFEHNTCDVARVIACCR